MKVGLIDIDSKIPNLALMKFSQHHKQLGATVELTSPLFAGKDGFDLLIASKVFKFSPMPILPANTQIGGSGYNFSKKLTESVEHIYPDYKLYNCDYAIGYTSRGCNRKCSFCIVPEKEGKFKITCENISEFWRGQKQLMLLDNSINTNESHFMKIAEQLIDRNIEVGFNQGLDIRRLTSMQCSYLTKIKIWKQIYFAWDDIKTEKKVLAGIELLNEYKLKSKAMFYVLIGFDSTQEEDLYRVEMLRKLKVEPFVVPFDKFNQYQKDFARWVNHKAIFKTVNWKDYKKHLK
jgi:hypothetical protein